MATDTELHRGMRAAHNPVGRALAAATPKIVLITQGRVLATSARSKALQTGGA